MVSTTNPLPIDIVLGEKRTCVLFDNGRLKCFGDNTDGRLGQGNTDNIGDDPDEMGENLVFIDFGVNRTVRQVSMGLIHTCVLFEDPNENGENEVACFGTGVLGLHFPLGSGYSCEESQIKIQSNVGDAQGELTNPEIFRPVPLGASAISIHCGGFHCCARVAGSGNSTELKCWGQEIRGKLGTSIGLKYGLQCRGSKLCPSSVTPDNTDCAPTVDFGDGLSVLQATSTEFHTCALLSNHKIKCFGSAQILGIGTNVTDISSTPVRDLPFVDLGDDVVKVTSVKGYQTFTCAILEVDTGEQKLKCYVQNNFNRKVTAIPTSGTDSPTNPLETRGDDPGEMGNNLPFVAEGVEVLEVAPGFLHTCIMYTDSPPDNNERRKVACWGSGGVLGQNLTSPQLGLVASKICIIFVSFLFLLKKLCRRELGGSRSWYRRRALENCSWNRSYLCTA